MQEEHHTNPDTQTLADPKPNGRLARIGRGVVNTIYCLGGLAVVFIVAVVMLDRVETTPEAEPSSPPPQAAAPTSPAAAPGSGDPWDPHCRRAILTRLREPSSATIIYDGLNKTDGASYKRVSAEADARLYEVSATNGFGGMDRRTWSCERIHGAYWVIER